jgi:glycosyltransferase involved in cell wall biosynthesis
MTTVPAGCLSVVIPCFNEEATVATVIDTVLAQPCVGEVIVVDDGSTDKSREILAAMDEPRLRVILQPRNQGKGAALRTGFAQATREYVVVQDADLEYDPDEFAVLLEPARGRQGRRGVRFALRQQPPPPGAVLLALARQQVAHAGVERVHRPEPHRHGDLLQGLPP